MALATLLLGLAIGFLLVSWMSHRSQLEPIFTKECYWIVVRDGVGRRLGKDDLGPLGWDGVSDEFGNYSRKTPNGEWIDVTTGKKVEKLGPPGWKGDNVSYGSFVYVDP
jgi:hypothetical protein